MPFVKSVSVPFVKTESVPFVKTAVLFATSGSAGVEVLVIGIADETLMQCEYEFRNDDALRRRLTLQGLASPGRQRVGCAL